MITDDEIMRLFEQAALARDDDRVRTVDAAGYLGPYGRGATPCN